MSGSTVLAWLVALGGPALVITTGLAVAPFYFALGIMVSYLGTAWFLLDWWHVSRKKPLLTRLLVSLIPLAAAGIVSWTAFRPAPLDVFARIISGAPYATGSQIGSISNESDTDLRIFIRNPTDVDYSNVGFVFFTDLSIAGFDVRYDPAPCSPHVYTFRPTEIIDDPREITAHAVPFARVFCDRLAAKSQIEVTAAIVRPDPNFAISGNMERTPPKRVFYKINYDGWGRSRRKEEIIFLEHQ